MFGGAALLLLLASPDVRGADQGKVYDPNHRIVAIEFQAADGTPLRYNHNGYYHSEADAQTGFDIYHLRAALAADARLVCWLRTDRSVLKQPFQISELRLPEQRVETPSLPAGPQPPPPRPSAAAPMAAPAID